MARAYRGPYARQSTYAVPYATAAVWGTGIDPIHSYYGEGPPLRVIGRSGHIGSSPVGGSQQNPRERDYQNPADSSGEDPPQEVTWGYPVDEGTNEPNYSPDSFGLGADAPISYEDTGPSTYQYMDDRPAWNEPTESARLRMNNPSTMAPWGTPGGRWMRALREGSHRFRIREAYPGNSAYAPVSAEPSNSNPTETVSEGWLNKVTSFIPDANPAADAQVFVQTSMVQRYREKDNRRAVLRATDDARHTISSRVEGMVEKVYSTGERSYDMFPYQIDQMDREFRFRTPGLGRTDWLKTNEYQIRTPFQRTPPVDVSMGIPEVAETDGYGYTTEDTMYYGQ